MQKESLGGLCRCPVKMVRLWVLSQFQKIPRTCVVLVEGKETCSVHRFYLRCEYEGNYGVKCLTAVNKQHVHVIPFSAVQVTQGCVLKKGNGILGGVVGIACKLS